MLSSCKPVQIFVNMQIERYGKRKGFPHLCTAIIGNTSSIFFLKLLNTVMMENICKEYNKDILQELGSSIYAFLQTTMALTIGGWGN